MNAARSCGTRCFWTSRGTGASRRGYAGRIGRRPKAKVESGVKYMRRNFLCGLQGQEPSSLPDLNTQLREWVSTVANQRVHGTTGEQVSKRWEGDRLSLNPTNGQVAY